MATWQCGSKELRDIFPHTRNGIYLDHASIGPLSRYTRHALEEHVRSRSEGVVNTYPEDIVHARQCRQLCATLVHAESPERIAFFMNTSDALNIVPAGLRWNAGDRILLNDMEFPANVYPYHNLKKHGVEIEFLQTYDGEVTPEMIEHAITRSGGRVRLVGLSAVQFLTGFRADMAAIGEVCKRHHAFFVVDAIQAAGAVPLDVQAMKIDALASGAQKWLMSTTGLAFLYLTEELQQRIEQAHLGWISVATPWDFFNYEQDLHRTATRYENGTLNFPGIIALGASLQTLLDIGVSNTERHLQELTQILIEGLQQNPAFEHVTAFAPERRAGIIGAHLKNPSTGEALCQELSRRAVTVSLRESRIRFSPHCYNTREEVVATLDAVRECT